MHLTDTCCLSERERNEGGVLHGESFRNLENVRNFWSAGNKWKGKKENFPQFLCPWLAILAVSFLRALFLSFSLFLSRCQNQWAPCSHSLAACQIFPQRDDIIDCRQVWMFCQHSRAFMIARRCVARNILYPNQKLMKLDCLPNHIFQNRELCK